MQGQLIYPQENVAALIAGKLGKSKGIVYEVKKVTTGFLVEPAPGQTIPISVVPDEDFQIIMPVKTAQPKPPFKTWTQNGEFNIDMVFKSESKEWISAKYGDQTFWVAKKSLIGWQLVEEHLEPKKWRLTMSIPYAKSRGLLPK